MLHWAPYPFVRVTLAFILGVLLYLGWGGASGIMLLGLLLAAFVLAALLAQRVKTAWATDMAGIAGLVLFASIGYSTTHLRTEKHDSHHLLNLAAAPTHYMGVVEDYVLQKPGYQSTVLQVQQVKVGEAWQTATGKVQLSVPHDSAAAYMLNYGDVLLVKGSPQVVQPPLNPAQFNYKAYLAHKNILHRHYLQSHQYRILASEPPNQLLYLSIQVRRHLDALLRQYMPERREYAIASALILGVKDDLDNSIRQAYADTGTMHVLAVSGLHVGLIYGLLMALLGKFNATTRQRWAGALLVLACLWLYAFVTGLSPSVMRAVLMFSLATVGLALRRRTVVYNTVAIAALALLFLNPYNLLEVGFQLSFLAVLGIVYLQPRFEKLLVLHHPAPRFVWTYFTVAVAAQLATLPLGLYYFHQFPVYFWFANILVVPLATGVLYSGVAALAFSWVPGLGWLLFQVHFWLTWCMNEFNLQVQHWPQALINGIDISGVQALLFYLLLFLFILFAALRKLRFMVMAAGVVALLAGQQLLENVQQKAQRQLVIYSVRNATGIGLLQGQQAVLLADSAMQHNPANYSFNVQPHLWQHGVQQARFVNLQAAGDANLPLRTLPDGNQLLVWQGQRWLILSHPPKYKPAAGFASDYLLLRQNVRLKPEQLQQYRFRMLVLDGSNKAWYLRRLLPQLDSLRVPYHNVATDGAFVVK